MGPRDSVGQGPANPVDDAGGVPHVLSHDLDDDPAVLPEHGTSGRILGALSHRRVHLAVVLRHDPMPAEDQIPTREEPAVLVGDDAVDLRTRQSRASQQDPKVGFTRMCCFTT